MIFRTISDAEWRDFATRCPAGNFLQSPAMAQRYADKGLEYYLLGVEHDGRLVLAALVVSTRSLAGQKFFKAPGGPLTDFDDPAVCERLKFFTLQARRFLRQRKGCILQISPCVELRRRDRKNQIFSHDRDLGINHEPVKDFLEEQGWKYLGEFEQAKWQFCLDTAGTMRRNLELASEAELPEDATAPVTPEVVFRHFRTDHRQRIRRAEREGLRVRQLAADELDVLKEIAAEAGERHGFHDPDLKYYQEMAKAFGDRVEFWVVEAPQEEETPREEETPQEEEALKWTPVCAAMFVLTNHEIVYLYSGSKRAYQKLGGAHLLQWQMIQRAITGDYQRYNFYGVRPEEGNGVFAFKQGFKGYVVEQLGTLILPLTPLGAVFAWRQKPQELGSIH